MKTITTVDNIVREQSEQAKIEARKVSDALLISAPAEADGLVTYNETIYAFKELKADANHNDKETFAFAVEHNAEYRDARNFVKNRNKALALVAPIRQCHSAMIEARAELAEIIKARKAS